MNASAPRDAIVGNAASRRLMKLHPPLRLFCRDLRCGGGRLGSSWRFTESAPRGKHCCPPRSSQARSAPTCMCSGWFPPWKVQPLRKTRWRPPCAMRIGCSRRRAVRGIVRQRFVPALAESPPVACASAASSGR